MVVCFAVLIVHLFWINYYTAGTVATGIEERKLLVRILI